MLRNWSSYYDVEFRSGGRKVGRCRDRRDDDEQAVVVTGDDALVFDRDRQRNSLDELAMHDLLLYEGAPAKARRLTPPPGGDQRALVQPDAQRLGVGTCNLDHDHDPPAVLVNEDVGVRRERPQPGPNDELHRLLNPAY